MKPYILIFLFWCAGCTLNWAMPNRRHLVFDYQWHFRLCQDSADARQQCDTLFASPLPTWADSAHTEVSLPHDWSITLPIDPNQGGAAGYLPGGNGLYVKDFTWPQGIDPDRRIALRVEAAYHRATVWLNGHQLGHHMYGYTPFELDLTPYLHTRGRNRLVIHCQTQEQSRWYTGAGLYRHVWLIETQRQHFATNGIFVQARPCDTASVTTSDWDIHCQCTIIQGEGCTTEHRLLDATGRSIGGTFTTQTRISGNDITLWDIDHPTLYYVQSRLRNAKGKVVDEMITPIGLRYCTFDADTGFALNGRRTKLRGMCLHQDAGDLGVAVPDRVIERRLQRLKALGCNAIRSAHNPASTAMLNICDTLGLLVIDEAFDKWKSGYYAPYYDSCAEGDLTDMICNDRNHPSIIIWSIGNELQEAWLPAEPVTPGGKPTNEGIARARRLNDIAHRLDPTRPTIVACQQGFTDAFGEVTDLVGYNYLEPRMLQDHRRHPQRKMLVTESFVYYSGLREDIVRDWEERNPWNWVEENDFIAGSFVWAGVDYRGESSPWPAKGWCSCPFDMTLDERPQAAYYHTVWQPERPYLKLVVRDNCWPQCPGTDHWQYPLMADCWDMPFDDGRTVQVRCYTTCDSVQFFFPMWSNPQLPLQPRITSRYPDHTITLQLPARRGKVLAVGYRDGLPVLRDSLVNHGPVCALRIDNDRPTLRTLPADRATLTDSFGPIDKQAGRLYREAGSQSMTLVPSAMHQTVAHIRVTTVDSLGRKQQMDPRMITAQVDGPGRLLSIESGDFGRSTFTGNSVRSYFGSVLLRVQSTHQPGTIRVKISADGIEPRYVEIESQP